MSENVDDVYDDGYGHRRYDSILSTERTSNLDDLCESLRSMIRSINRSKLYGSVLCFVTLSVAISKAWQGTFGVSLIYVCLVWHIYREYRCLLTESDLLKRALFHIKAERDYPKHAEFHYQQWQAILTSYVGHHQESSKETV